MQNAWIPVERCVQNAWIPVERCVQNALKAIAGLRHGKVAELRWCHYDPTLEPLGRLVIATSYDTGRTKTEVTRRVPVHPTLGKILAAWKLSHWERIYGRAPTPDDLIVPTRNMTPVAPKEANDAFKRDLDALGLYARAGLAKPAKPLHCLRHSFGTVMARRVPLGVLQRLMGHSEVSTTMRYVDVGEEDKRDAIAAVFGAFGQQAGNKAGAAGSTEAFSVEKQS